MKSGLISPHWYRVAKLKPVLHSNIEIHRHDYRGLIWYMLEDITTGRNHRFNPAAYQFIGQMDGNKTVQEIYDNINEQLENFAPGQLDIIHLIGQLHSADLIKTDVLINTEELLERHETTKASRLKQRFMNPVAMKLPLWDPEEFLNKHFPKVRWIFSYQAALVWLMIIIIATTQAAQNWPEIRQYFNINALSPYNLLLMFLIYPPLKILHELGHAFSAKLEGGEIHEMGVNFLMFMPIPYVNVSTVVHFQSKYKRMLVSSAGILVESFLAALGLLLFLATEPGITHSIGFNMFLIGGVSSIFFNGNPLLKYDGYYILADAIGIPNLYERSSQYWRYLFQRYLFGLNHVSSPATAPGEVQWFFFYSLSAMVYRLAVLWFIFVMVTEKFFLFGVLLTLWLLGLQILIPIIKSIRFILTSPSLHHKRKKSILISSALMVLFSALFGLIPVPSYTLTEGVVWQPEEVQLKTEQNGFIEPITIKNNQIVEAGTTVIQLSDPFLKAEEKIALARLNELKRQYRGERFENYAKAGIILNEIRVAESELTHIQNKNNSMSVKTFKKGRLIIPNSDDLPGNYVRQGELLGYILDSEPSTIRMAVSQDNIGQLRSNIEDIKIRFASDVHTEYTGKIIRQSPEGTNRLPSAALATNGGGKFFVSQNAQGQMQTSQKIFIIDLHFDSQNQEIKLGTRAYVRISHGGESVIRQVYRRVRQAFLRRFNV